MTGLRWLRAAAQRLAPIALAVACAASAIPAGADGGCCDTPAGHCHRVARLVSCGCDAFQPPATQAVASAAASMSAPQAAAGAAPPAAHARPDLPVRCTAGARLGRWLVPLPILHGALLI